MLLDEIQQAKGKQILTEPEKPKDLGEEIANIINKAYEKKFDWFDEQYGIKIDKLMEISEFIGFQIAMDEQQ